MEPQPLIRAVIGNAQRSPMRNVPYAAVRQRTYDLCAAIWD